MELPNNTGINEYTIKLIEGKQPPYSHIYVFSPVELKTLKTYIITHIKTGFIQPSKSPAIPSILFDKRSDSSFCLYIDYQSLNNFTIKNRYFLLFIDKCWDWLG